MLARSFEDDVAHNAALASFRLYAGEGAALLLWARVVGARIRAEDDIDRFYYRDGDHGGGE